MPVAGPRLPTLNAPRAQLDDMTQASAPSLISFARSAARERPYQVCLQPARPARNHELAQCKIVSIATSSKARCAQEYKGHAAPAAKARQCADPGLTSNVLSTPSSSSNHSFQIKGRPEQWQSEGTVKRGARSATTTPAHIANLPFQPTRKPRRVTAKIERMMSKPWRDLTKVEKAAVSIAKIAASGGMTVSLNFGFRRSTLIDHQNPRRLFEKHLNKHLNAAGLGGQRFALTLEMTPENSHGFSRLHVHGAIETAHLSGDDRVRLEEALCKAASVATGALGGKRQLVMKEFTSASGWIDYCLEDQAKTKGELQIDDLWILPHAMRRAAQAHHEELRRERCRNERLRA